MGSSTKNLLTSPIQPSVIKYTKKVKLTFLMNTCVTYTYYKCIFYWVNIGKLALKKCWMEKSVPNNKNNNNDEIHIKERISRITFFYDILQLSSSSVSLFFIASYKNCTPK